MQRESFLDDIRSALNPAGAQANCDAPFVRLTVPDVSLEERIQRFSDALHRLGGTVQSISPTEARDCVKLLIGSKKAVASNAPILHECGITSLTGVWTAPKTEDELRSLCACADLGITGADYALADTGSLVLFSSREEPRMISLLPPVHVAVIARERILTNLDELLQIVPHPDIASSSMLLITGPSRTADIEQILIRRVHGPGDLHVLIL